MKRTFLEASRGTVVVLAEDDNERPQKKQKLQITPDNSLIQKEAASSPAPTPLFTAIFKRSHTATQDITNLLDVVSLHGQLPLLDRDTATNHCRLLLQTVQQGICSRGASVEVTAQAALQQLVTLSQAPHQSSLQHVEQLISQLFSALSPLLRGSKMDIQAPLLSTGIWRQLLQSLLLLGRTKVVFAGSGMECVHTLARASLASRDGLVRSAGLQVLSMFCSIDDSRAVQLLLARHAQNDVDARVRTTGLRCLMHLHQRGAHLSGELYEAATSGLEDECDTVRQEAVKLTWQLSNLHPQHAVGRRKDRLRLVDDGFVRLCNRVTDTSMAVRAQACRLLGSMRHVHPRLLLQTLSKELITVALDAAPNSGRVKAGLAGDSSLLLLPAADAPAELADEVRLSSSDVHVAEVGAAGAFVHGLEDEYWEVRCAAIDSLCELGVRASRFAIAASEFLVDMFNDELEGVRINAIHSLRKLGTRVAVTEGQVQVVVSTLEEGSREVRAAVHKLLGAVRLASAGSLQAAVTGLLSNLQRYPSDHDSVLRCCQALGARHPHFAAVLADVLLARDHRFAPVVPHVDDVPYRALLVVFANAACACPRLWPLLPPYMRDHLVLFREKLPELFPPAPTDWACRPVSLPELSLRVRAVARHSMDAVMAALPPSGDAIDGVDRALRPAVRDLQSMAALDTRIVSLSSFYTHLLKGMAVLADIAPHIAIWPRGATATPLATACHRLLRLAYKVEHRYVGLHAAVRLWLMLWRALARAMVMPLASQPSPPLARRLLDIEAFAAKYAVELSPVPSPHATVQAIASWLYEGIRSVYTSYVQGFDNDVKQIAGHITSPKGSTDKPIDTPAGLPLSLELEAELDAIPSVRSIALLAMLPDQSTALLPIPARHCSPTCPMAYTLRTTVSLPIGTLPWTESCNIQLAMVRLYEPEERGSLEEAVLPMASSLPGTPKSAFYFPISPRKSLSVQLRPGPWTRRK